MSKVVSQGGGGRMTTNQPKKWSGLILSHIRGLSRSLLFDCQQLSRLKIFHITHYLIPLTGDDKEPGTFCTQSRCFTSEPQPHYFNISQRMESVSRFGWLLTGFNVCLLSQPFPLQKLGRTSSAGDSLLTSTKAFVLYLILTVPVAIRVLKAKGIKHRKIKTMLLC